MPTVARFPQLAHWGAFTAIVEDGVLTRCEPFHRDRYPSKMLASIPASIYSDKRIKRPAVRKSWLKRRERSDTSLRGREEFIEVSWERALDLVADEIRRVRAEHGPESIFAGSYGWSSAGRFHHARSLIRRFYFANDGCIDQIGNYSWGTAQFILPYVIGSYAPLVGRTTDWPNILRKAQILLCFGGLALKNGQITSGGAAEHSQEYWLRQLGDTRLPIINISPTKGDTPSFLNAEWIPIRPNTDVALMLALAYEIIVAKAHNKSYLDRYCIGYDQLARYILGQSDGVAKSPDWASPITGVDSSKIRSLAKRMCGVTSYITCSFSVQRAQHGEQPYWMAIALSAILGQIGVEGGGFGFGHGSMNGIGNPRDFTPGPEMSVGTNPIGKAIPVARLADMLLSPGSSYEFNGKTQVYPDVHLIHWAGGNPFHHHQQLNKLLHAWQKPKTIIVNDIWWTPTARLADVVLPATSSLERNDIGGSSRDRYILAMHRAISPLHGARGDWDIFVDLADRLGTRGTFTENRGECEWLQHIYNKWRAAQYVDLPDFDQFWNAGYAEIPLPKDDFVWMADFHRDPLLYPLKTFSGKIELYSNTIESFKYDDCGPHPQWLPPDEWLGASETETYPLHLVSVQPHDRLHSQMDFGPVAQANKINGREAITLHPSDARGRGLVPGSTVRVFNSRGSCLAGLAVSDDVMPGVAVMATGSWFTPDFHCTGRPEHAGTVNVLTKDIGTSQLTQGPNAMSCLVEVSPWEDGVVRCL